MTHFLFTAICAILLNTGAYSAPADTLNQYVIDNQAVENFDGSQLVGEKIVSYDILTVEKEGKIIRIHEIKTWRKSQPVWIIDGKVASRTVFEGLDPKAIKSISVLKANNIRIQSYEKYGDISGGVIVVELNDPGTYTPSNAESKPALHIRINGNQD